jgi:hypothetical protein
MKYILLFSFVFILCLNIADAQTNAGIPDASTVLVVFNGNSTLSDSIMQYYVAARGIPYPQNVVELQLPRREINVGDWSDPHVVKLGYSDEYIQDPIWA